MVIFESIETTFNENGVMEFREKINGTERSIARVHVVADSVDFVKEAFQSGGTWSIFKEEDTFSFADFPVLVQIIDKMNGEIQVYMAKKTDVEILEEENAALFFQLMTGEEFV